MVWFVRMDLYFFDKVDHLHQVLSLPSHIVGLVYNKNIFIHLNVLFMSKKTIYFINFKNFVLKCVIFIMNHAFKSVTALIF